MPGSFWTTPPDGAAKELAAILETENADVLTCYDDHGGYGHPDHIQVHGVGMRAAGLAGTRRVYQSPINRDHVRRGIERDGRAGRGRRGDARIGRDGGFRGAGGDDHRGNDLMAGL